MNTVGAQGAYVRSVRPIGQGSNHLTTDPLRRHDQLAPENHKLRHSLLYQHPHSCTNRAIVVTQRLIT
jgi:hypothetical protein